MKPRIDRIDQILDQIHRDPKSYNQSVYCKSNCGAAYCIAGWAVIFRHSHLHEMKMTPEYAHAFVYKAAQKGQVVKLTNEWLGLPHERETPSFHPLFDENLALSVIISRRNEMAAKQGLPAYIYLQMKGSRMNPPRIDRIDKILDCIHLYPENYNQTDFVQLTDECNTAFCIAGWAVVFAEEEAIGRQGSLKERASMVDCRSASWVVAVADKYLQTEGPYAASVEHPLFDSDLELDDIIARRNEYAAEQGLPAYVAPKDSKIWI